MSSLIHSIRRGSDDGTGTPVHRPAQVRIAGVPSDSPYYQALLSRLRPQIVQFHRQQARKLDASNLEVTSGSGQAEGVKFRYESRFGVETIFVETTDKRLIEAAKEEVEKKREDRLYDTAIVEFQIADISEEEYLPDDNVTQEMFRAVSLVAIVPPRGTFETPEELRRFDDIRSEVANMGWDEGNILRFADGDMTTIGGTFNPDRLFRASLKVDLRKIHPGYQMEVQIYGKIEGWQEKGAEPNSSILVATSVSKLIELLPSEGSDLNYPLVDANQHVITLTPVVGVDWAAGYGSTAEAYTDLFSFHTDHPLASNMIIDGSETGVFQMEISGDFSEEQAPIEFAIVTESYESFENSDGEDPQYFIDAVLKRSYENEKRPPTMTPVGALVVVDALTEYRISWYYPKFPAEMHYRDETMTVRGGCYFDDPFNRVSFHYNELNDHELQFYHWENATSFPDRPRGLEDLGTATLWGEDKADTTIQGNEFKFMGIITIDAITGAVEWVPA